MTKRVVCLTKIAGEKALLENKTSRAALFGACREISAELNGVAGYAIVAWDRRGEMRSAIFAGSGPIGAGMIPTLAHDALNRHVALEMAPPKPIAD